MKRSVDKNVDGARQISPAFDAGAATCFASRDARTCGNLMGTSCCRLTQAPEHTTVRFDWKV
jgi:hypothetical protein